MRTSTDIADEPGKRKTAESPAARGPRRPSPFMVGRQPLAKGGARSQNGAAPLAYRILAEQAGETISYRSSIASTSWLKRNVRDRKGVPPMAPLTLTAFKV